MEHPMSWSMNVHLTETARPEIVEGSISDRTGELRFFGINYPDITMFAKTDAHKRWLAAMAAASAEFWRREDAAEPKTARAA